MARGELAARVITLDSSGLISLLNSGDPDHRSCRDALESDRGPFFVVAFAMAEVAYFVERRLPESTLHHLLDDIEQGAFLLDPGTDDIPRIRELVSRYADLRLGFTDAAVIACAERHGGRVLTLDRRHFAVVAREGTITLLPDLP
jgi:uncharacterized protein